MSSSSPPSARHPGKIFVPEYVIVMFVLWVGGWVLPSMVMVLFYWFLFLPNIQLIANLMTIWTDWRALSIWLATPWIIIGIHLLHVGSVVIIARLLLSWYNWRCPPHEFRNLVGSTAEEKRELTYYYLRGYILRFTKWVVTKSIFPWLTAWAFNFLKTNKIGKNVTLEDQFIPMNNVEFEENTYVGVGSLVSSHLVDGRTKGYTLMKTHIGKNCVLNPLTSISPGVNVGDNVDIIALSGVEKYTTLPKNAHYEGIPANPMGKKRFKKFVRLSLSAEKSKEGI